MKRSIVWIGIGILTVLLGYHYFLGAQQMLEIKFDLGKNIVETARASGIPKFSVDNVNGSVFYSRNQLPADIPARYSRPGYEVVVGPLFAFTLYADEKKLNNLAVTTATLQIDSIKSHDAAKNFVEQLLAQFRKGNWKRHLSEYCPAVSGRSSLLNEAGELDLGTTCPLDPDYKLTKEEWLAMMSMGKVYRWVGDGVIAELTLSYREDATGVTYNMSIEFEDEAIQKQRYSKAIADDIKEGESKGWNTLAEISEDKKKTETKIKLLEANALKRGDHVVPR